MNMKVLYMWLKVYFEGTYKLSIYKKNSILSVKFALIYAVQFALIISSLKTFLSLWFVNLFFNKKRILVAYNHDKKT